MYSVVTPHSARLNYCCVPQHVKAKPWVLRSLDICRSTPHSGLYAECSWLGERLSGSCSSSAGSIIAWIKSGRMDSRRASSSVNMTAACGLNCIFIFVDSFTHYGTSFPAIYFCPFRSAGTASLLALPFFVNSRSMSRTNSEFPNS